MNILNQNILNRIVFWFKLKSNHNISILNYKKRLQNRTTMRNQSKNRSKKQRNLCLYKSLNKVLKDEKGYCYSNQKLKNMIARKERKKYNSLGDADDIQNFCDIEKYSVILVNNINGNFDFNLIYRYFIPIINWNKQYLVICYTKKHFVPILKKKISVIENSLVQDTLNIEYKKRNNTFDSEEQQIQEAIGKRLNNISFVNEEQQIQEAIGKSLNDISFDEVELQKVIKLSYSNY